MILQGQTLQRLTVCTLLTFAPAPIPEQQHAVSRSAASVTVPVKLQGLKTQSYFFAPRWAGMLVLSLFLFP